MMDTQDQTVGEGDDEALLRQRLQTTPAANPEFKVRAFRRRRSSGLLFQVRRKQPHRPVS
jgi:hypothetical protein